MLKSLSRHRLLVLVAGIFLLMALVAAISFLVPLVGEVCSKNEYTGAKECASYHIALATFWQIIKATNDYGSAITALATIAVAGFTLTLWLTSKEQGRLTREVIQLTRDEFNATHRPRLRVRFVRHEPMSVKGDTPLRMKYAIVNAGEGRAHITEHKTTIIITSGGDNAKPHSHFDIPAPQVMDLATGESWNFITSKDADFDGFEDFGALMGDGVLVFRGMITYRDDADISRTTAWERIYDTKLKGFRKMDNSDHEYED